MRSAMDTLHLNRLVVIYPGERHLALAEQIQTLGLTDLVNDAGEFA